jgi:predicted AlkP superfamily phosphohydrolase/phosphomutase
MNRKLVHIGLDGLNPDLVQEWRAELPNLDGLMEEGMWGRMESTVPPITPQAWTCMMSGKNPGQFGFWNFTYRSEYSYGEPNLVNSGVVMERVDTLYTILPRMGKKVAIINLPVSYPPPRIENSYSISCFLTPNLERPFTHPPELKEEITKIIGEYIIDASTSDTNYRVMDKDLVLKRIYDMDKQRFDLIEYFVKEKKCDYVFAVIMGTDRMPHLFYRYFDKHHVRYESNPQYADALKNHYKFCDSNIGRIKAMLDSNTTMLINSDHSVQRLDGRINLNEWLLNEDYMKLNSYPEKLTPLRDCHVDWNGTMAWATGYTGQIYLNIRGREKQGIIKPKDYNTALDELTQKILDIKDPKGNKLDTEVFKRTEIHSGPYSRYGPDLFINFDDCRWNISELIGYGEGEMYSFDTPLGTDDGGHGQFGFFVMAGPGIPNIGEITAHLIDVAPTVLSLMDVPVSGDMEGHVLVKSEPGVVYSKEDVDEVKKRLEALGYLG